MYGAIAYCFANRDEVNQWLERQDQLWDQVRRLTAQKPSPVVQRLRALGTVPQSTANLCPSCGKGRMVNRTEWRNFELV